MFKKSIMAVAVALAANSAHAIDPITSASNAANYAADFGALNQTTNPFLLAPGWKATFITDRTTLSSQPEWQGDFGNWDMVDVDPTGQYIFIPFETGNAGIVRYDRVAATSTTLIGSTGSTFDTNPNDGWDALNDRFQRFDPALYTPAGTVLTGEEEPTGRLFEVLNPLSATGRAVGAEPATVRWLSNIPAIHHEGLRFDSQERLYFVDENNSGSIYRMTPNTTGDYSAGKVEVLVDNDMTANYGANWNDAANQVAGARTGAASWMEIVDVNGNATTTADPFDFGAAGGRGAADEVAGTPYGRPEDMVIGTLNGTDVLYFATTSENIVYGINLDTNEVFEAMATGTTIDTTTGLPVVEGGPDTDYGFDDPDNVEISFGPNGEIQLFAIEDENPGDIWMGTDTDGDLIMDEITLFATLGAFGSEPTGFIYDPWTGGFLVNIQHPGDGNDALWSVTPVPVPAAVWMMAPALAGFARFRRKRS